MHERLTAISTNRDSKILTHRFLKNRTEFTAKHRLLNAKKFVNALGVVDSNPSRYMSRMRKKT